MRLRYCSDLVRPAAVELARELRESGEYVRVEVVWARPDNGREFRSVFVETRDDVEEGTP